MSFLLPVSHAVQTTENVVSGNNTRSACPTAVEIWKTFRNKIAVAGVVPWSLGLDSTQNTAGSNE